VRGPERWARRSSHSTANNSGFAIVGEAGRARNCLDAGFCRRSGRLLVPAFGGPGGEDGVREFECLVEDSCCDDAIGWKWRMSLRSSHHAQRRVAST
jgi:hypothetical protein